MLLRELLLLSEGKMDISEDNGKLVVSVGGKKTTISDDYDAFEFLTNQLADDRLAAKGEFFVAKHMPIIQHSQGMQDKEWKANGGTPQDVVRQAVAEFNETGKKPFVVLQTYVGNGDGAQNGLVKADGFKAVSDKEFKASFDPEKDAGVCSTKVGNEFYISIHTDD